MEISEENLGEIVSYLIHKRRSVRRYYEKKPVSEKLICDVLSDASFAPSSGNIQNWRFVVVRKKNQREKIAEACLGQQWMVSAPVHIVICSDDTEITRHYRDKAKFYSIQNCAAAAQNLLISAEARGLSTCWVGAFDEISLKKTLQINGIEIHAVITLGYSSEKIKENPQRDSLKQITHFEFYGNKDSAFQWYPVSASISKIENSLSNKFSSFKEKLKKIISKDEKEDPKYKN